MFEFESHGGINDLMDMEDELLGFLGFGDEFHKIKYDAASFKYKADELGYDEEEALCKDFGTCTFLTHFPQRTHPFWNMKQQDGGLHFNKVDVLLYGMETIGSAERSCDVDQMRELFYSISSGQYAKLLFNHFGKLRVERELEDYFSLNTFERFGGGIGVTRMCRALSMLNLF